MVTDAIIGCIQIGLYSVAASSLICAWIMWGSRYKGARLSSVRPSWRDDVDAVISGKLGIDDCVERWSGKMPLKQGLFVGYVSANTENIALLTTSAPNWQTMDRGLFIGDTKNSNPSGFAYYENGVGKWRGSDGKVSDMPPDVTRIEGDCSTHIGCTKDKCFLR